MALWKKDYSNNINNIMNYNSDILELITDLIEIDDIGNESCLIDVCSILNVLRYLYYGIDENGKKALRAENFKNILKMSPKAQHSRSAVLLRRGEFSFNPDYCNDIISNKPLLDFIPYNDDYRRVINQRMTSQFPNFSKVSDKEFLQKTIDPHVFIYIKDESLFDCKWSSSNDFDETLTTREDFYKGNNLIIDVEMMKNTDKEIECLQSNRFDAQIVRLHYAKDDKGDVYSKLIIMPNKPRSKAELFYLIKHCLNGNEINALINSLKTRKDCSLKYPKFKIRSEIEINGSLLENPKVNVKQNFLKTFFNTNYKYTELSPRFAQKNPHGGQLVSISNVTNNETGTKIFTETEFWASDGVVKKYEININKSFIYMIMDKYNKICSLGIFVGDV